MKIRDIGVYHYFITLIQFYQVESENNNTEICDSHHKKKHDVHHKKNHPSIISG